MAQDVFLAAEIADDALLDVAVCTDGLDETDISVAADALVPDEHEASIRKSAASSSSTDRFDRQFSTTLLSGVEAG